MKIIKQFPLIILIAIFLISCRTPTNKDYPINNLGKNIDENPNPEKKRMEIKFSCGEDGIKEYLDNGWNILKEDSQEKICTWKSVPATKEQLVDLIFKKLKTYENKKIFLERESLNKFVLSLFKGN